MLSDAIETNPDILSGQPVFKGSRVPVAALFENLRDGVTIDGFLELFPGLTEKQVKLVIDHEIDYFQSNEDII